MNVALMQPAFLPWQGYFGLICRSDIFVFLDDFQFSVQSYHQRNMLFLNKNIASWYTVPVKKTTSFKKSLNETRINYNSSWQKKMLKRIKQNYYRSFYFKEYYPFIEEWIMTKYGSLAELNIEFILQVCKWLGLEKSFAKSSKWPSSKKRSERVLELLHINGAQRYICANGSFNYMVTDGIFPVNDVEVVFQKYKLIPYPQVCSNEFIPSLSILDALFNVGGSMTNGLLLNGSENWIHWENMKL